MVERFPLKPLTDLQNSVRLRRRERMGAERPSSWDPGVLERYRDELIDQLCYEENCGWHHLPNGDQRFQVYLRTKTWIEKVEEAIQRNQETT